MTRTLSRNEDRRYYDSFGAKQDWQGIYEDAAIERMIELGAFSDALSVFELGCGTGRLAGRLLTHHLPCSARYVGIDISSTMVRLARDRLAPIAARSKVHLSGGPSISPRMGGRSTGS